MSQELNSVIIREAEYLPHQDKTDINGLMDCIYDKHIITKGELDEQIEYCCKGIEKLLKINSKPTGKRRIIRIQMLITRTESNGGKFTKEYKKHRQYNIGAMRGQVMIDKGYAFLIE